MGNQDQTAHYPNMQGLPNTFPTNYRYVQLNNSNAYVHKSDLTCKTPGQSCKVKYLAQKIIALYIIKIYMYYFKKNLLEFLKLNYIEDIMYVCCKQGYKCILAVL